LDKTKGIYLDIELNNKVRKIFGNNDINAYIYYEINDIKKELNIYKEVIKKIKKNFYVRYIYFIF